ncbi:MAG TPA: hypothetical protein VLG76_04150 [Rhabdochlamydiaceae bacterium]|nr:hypothetical protein [Rhabdochlamydiaceae bacterium]
MDIHFDATKTACVLYVASQTPASDRLSPETRRDSLEASASPVDGFRCSNKTFFNNFIKPILNAINSFLIAIRIRPKPSIETEISGDEVNAKLDELIKHPIQFAAALGVHVPLSQRRNLKSINLKVNGDETPLFSALCFAEGQNLRFDHGKITVTPRVIKYVLENALGLDLKAKNQYGSSILTFAGSEEVLSMLLERDSSLITLMDKFGRTSLFYHVQEQCGKTIEECCKMVQLFILRSTDLKKCDSRKNSVLHVCKDQPIAALLLAADPHLIFALNEYYESPIDTAPPALKTYLTQFAEEHQELSPKDPNKLLEIAIGKAAYAEGRTPKPFETLETARTLIEAGADVSTRIKLDGGDTQSVLDCIILHYYKETWRELLPIAIQKATQEQIHSSLITTLSKAYDLYGDSGWIEAARELISASKAPCNDLRLRKNVFNPEKGEHVSQEKSLEEWDKEQKWDLFLKAMI